MTLIVSNAAGIHGDDVVDMLGSQIEHAKDIDELAFFDQQAQKCGKIIGFDAVQWNFLLHCHNLCLQRINKHV